MKKLLFVSLLLVLYAAECYQAQEVEDFGSTYKTIRSQGALANSLKIGKQEHTAQNAERGSTAVGEQVDFRRRSVRRVVKKPQPPPFYGWPSGTPRPFPPVIRA
ncbi:hypothetical protein R5R35_001027 [Gryllus longicercus]